MSHTASQGLQACSRPIFVTLILLGQQWIRILIKSVRHREEGSHCLRLSFSTFCYTDQHGVIPKAYFSGAKHKHFFAAVNGHISAGLFLLLFY